MVRGSVTPGAVAVDVLFSVVVPPDRRAADRARTSTCSGRARSAAWGAGAILPSRARLMATDASGKAPLWAFFGNVLK